MPELEAGRLPFDGEADITRSCAARLQPCRSGEHARVAALDDLAGQPRRKTPNRLRMKISSPAPAMATTKRRMPPDASRPIIPARWTGEREAQPRQTRAVQTTEVRYGSIVPVRHLRELTLAPLPMSVGAAASANGCSGEWGPARPRVSTACSTLYPVVASVGFGGRGSQVMAGLRQSSPNASGFDRRRSQYDPDRSFPQARSGRSCRQITLGRRGT